MPISLNLVVGRSKTRRVDTIGGTFIRDYNFVGFDKTDVPVAGQQLFAWWLLQLPGLSLFGDMQTMVDYYQGIASETARMWCNNADAGYECIQFLHF